LGRMAAVREADIEAAAVGWNELAGCGIVRGKAHFWTKGFRLL